MTASEKLRLLMSPKGDTCFEPTGEELSEDQIKKIWSTYYDKPWPAGMRVARTCLNPRCGHILHRYPTLDMDLDSYVKSVSEMSEEEILAQLASLRKERQGSVTRTKVSRKVSSDKDVKSFKKRPKELSKTKVIQDAKGEVSKDDLEALRREFGL